MSVPYIDPNVKQIPVSYLRQLTKEAMRQQTDTLVVNEFNGNDPLVVILPYKTFLLIQEQIRERTQS
jgi:hypothetical protein